MTKQTKKKLMDGAERALWTFVQAALAVMLLSSEPFSKTALIAGGAAGVSALKTFVKETL